MNSKRKFLTIKFFEYLQALIITALFILGCDVLRCNGMCCAIRPIHLLILSLFSSFYVIFVQVWQFSRMPPSAVKLFTALILLGANEAKFLRLSRQSDGSYLFSMAHKSKWRDLDSESIIENSEMWKTYWQIIKRTFFVLVTSCILMSSLYLVCSMSIIVCGTLVMSLILLTMLYYVITPPLFRSLIPLGSFRAAAFLCSKISTEKWILVEVHNASEQEQYSESNSLYQHFKFGNYIYVISDKLADS